MSGDIQADSDDERVARLSGPPPEIAILAGELLYQVRSTLEHLFFALIQRNQRGLPTMPDERDIQFPLNLALPTGVVATPVPRDKFVCRAKDWLSDEAFTFIESLQPYYTGNTEFAVLQHLSKIDRHRHLNSIGSGVEFSIEGYTATTRFSGTLLNRFDDGAEVPRLDMPFELANSPMYVKRHSTTKIAFTDPALPTPIAYELIVEDLPTLMFGRVVPRFDQLLK